MIVYDSLQGILSELKNNQQFKNAKIRYGFSKKKLQNDGHSCGPFAMATILALIKNQDPNKILASESFDISLFRNKLLTTIKDAFLSGEEDSIFEKLKKL